MNKARRLRVAMAALFALLLFVPGARAFTVSVAYPASGRELVNPYIGNAVWARDRDDHEQPFTLVYANLAWADFEPEPGQYDFEAFEEENRFDLWREQGKRLILRFVMDVPSSKKHRDIPDWLYDQIDGDGTAYNVSYGKGFSPNYANETLIRAHAAAIEALGARYGDDPFVAFIQLGSLGHWGEWHVHTKVGEMPVESVRDRYVLAYIGAFPDAFLLMRRPFAIAADYGLGLFNDAAGEPDPTNTWLTWISAGGDYETHDDDDALVPMPDAWQTAPIGGELSTAMDREDLLDSDFTQTLSLFTQSHASWIGPGSFADIPRGGSEQEALDALLRTLGYRLRISRCDVAQAPGGETQITLTWANDGIAPFYFGWRPTLAVADAHGGKTLYPLDLDLIEILPDQPASVSVTIPALDDEASPYTLWAAILDPATGEPGVALAMEAEEDGLWYRLIAIQN